MKTKPTSFKITIICVAAIVLIAFSLIVIWLSIQGYRYYNPNFEIHIFTRESEDLYWEYPSYTTWGDSAFGMSPKVYEAIKEFADETTAVDEWLHTYQLPIDVTCEVVIQGEQTIVTYEGTATNQNGEAENIYKQLVFDFVITENIIDHSVR